MAFANTQAGRAIIEEKNKSATFSRVRPTVTSTSNKAYLDRSKWQW